MILVFDTSAPPPRAIGAHEEDFTRSVGFCHDQRDAPEAVRLGRVRGEDLRARLRPGSGGIPLEPGQVRPDPRAGFIGILKLGQEAVRARLGQGEPPGRGGAETAGLRVVPNDREQVGERGALQGSLVAAQARHEDEPGGLVAHELLQGGALFKVELALVRRRRRPGRRRRTSPWRLPWASRTGSHDRRRANRGRGGKAAC